MVEYQGRYRHAQANNVDISTAGVMLQLEMRGRSQISIYVESDVNSDFDLEADFGDGTFVAVESFPTQKSVTQTRDISVERIRLVNKVAQTAGNAANVKLGAV